MGLGSYSVCALLRCHPRFGRSVAKVRSLRLKQVQKKARSFLRKAEEEGGELDQRPTTNAHWIKHADLYPVLSFLMNGK